MDSDAGSHSTIWSRLVKFFGRDDETLEKAILEASADGEVDSDEESMLLGILRFNDLQVQDTMIPRTDIDCVADDSTLLEVAQLIISSGHSRIPVYKETRDNIIGILHAKDILPCLIASENNSQNIHHVMREPFFVPETKSIRILLQEFRSRKQHIAIALDEYGGTSGLITIEDVLEEIVGNIEDEHDAPREEDVRKLEEQVFELTGRATLEEIAELGLAINTDEVDTIGGFLSMQAGHVPAPNETFVISGWRLSVLEADPKQIHRIRMEPAEKGLQLADSQPGE